MPTRTMRRRLPHTPARCYLLLALLALCCATSLADVFAPTLPPTTNPAQLGARLLHPRSTLPFKTVITRLDWLVDDVMYSQSRAEAFAFGADELEAAKSDDTAALLFLPAGLGSAMVRHRRHRARQGDRTALQRQRQSARRALFAIAEASRCSLLSGLACAHRFRPPSWFTTWWRWR